MGASGGNIFLENNWRGDPFEKKMAQKYSFSGFPGRK